jgi:alpha-L-rhamnosidase
MRAVNLQIKNYFSPIGIDTNCPVFSWQLESKTHNQTQSYYRVIVAENEGVLANNEGSIWDSGKVASSEQLVIVYDGTPLKSVSCYFWKVAVWNQDGQMEWSEPQLFFTGYLNHYEWKAKWLGNGGRKPFYARHQFDVSKKVRRAFALVSGLGHFKMFMNNEKIGDHEMDPGWTNYHKSVQYVCFDITAYLRPGANVIGVSIGNGFFAGDDGGRHFYTMDKGYQPYGEQLMTLGELHIEYEDGSRDLICTGNGLWKVRDSATSLANVYGSENFDARLYPMGWSCKDFNDFDWDEAKCVTPPNGKLISQNQPPITVKRVYDSIGITEPKENVFVFDLGQNMSGMFEIHATGPAGTKVKVTPGELLNEDGTVATPWDIVTYSEYTLNGTGDIEVWKPDFSCYGARWVQIEGCTRNELNKEEPFIHDVKGHFVTSASLDVGKFETDNPEINRLAEIILKSIESNLQSVHSDCPTIEKLGWVETAHLMGPSIMYVKHVEELWLKIVRDMIEAQTEEGLVPDIAPEYSRFEGGFRDSIAWGSSLVIVPDLLFEIYGNKTAIEQAYPSMKTYMAYLKTKEVHGGFINHGLGDWGIQPQTGGDYIENVETALYYYDYKLMLKFASMLGYDQEALFYKEEAERIKRIYNERLLIPAGDQYEYRKFSGEYDSNNQIIQAMPLYFDMVPEQMRKDVENSLVRATSNRQIQSGEIGLRYLFNALSNINGNRIVYDMMMQPEHPSYIRFVKNGETTLPEFWKDDARSRNHDMMGHILEWMYKELLGITSLKDAYKQILIAPYYAEELKQIHGHYNSVRGTIRVKFEHSKKEVRLQVSIPANTSAKVKIPLLSADSILFVNGQIVERKVVSQEGHLYAYCEILSGDYTFSVVEK